jgi:hypothetical protein
MTYFEPEYHKELVARVDPLDWQKELISSTTENGVVSDTEIYYLEKLWQNEKRWNVKRDIMRKIINDKYLKPGVDSDGDGVDNITEINQGTNALNDLEMDRNNLSETYFVILTNMGDHGTASGGIGIYHMSRMHGIDDDHILLIWHLEKEWEQEFEKRWKGMVMTGWLDDKGHPLKDLHIEIDYHQGLSKEDFFEEVKKLPIDDNDILLMYYFGEGDAPALFNDDIEGVRKDRKVFTPDGRELYIRNHIFPSEMNELINSLNYGRCMLINESCASERLYIDEYNIRGEVVDRGMYAPNQLNEFLGFAACGADEYTGGSFSNLLFMRLMGGYSLRESFDYAREKLITKSFDQHPKVFYFDPDGKECLWMNYTNPFFYLPRKESN